MFVCLQWCWGPSVETLGCSPHSDSEPVVPSPFWVPRLKLRATANISRHGVKLLWNIRTQTDQGVKLGHDESVYATPSSPPTHLSLIVSFCWVCHVVVKSLKKKTPRGFSACISCASISTLTSRLSVNGLDVFFNVFSVYLCVLQVR